ncbi:MAG: hypothetical protein DMD65_00970 [Gemmatimonadetes bacterium]|nr:MAG: hypothetical protein DMD65_00970 [Gemmatimonadota bacterium]
MDGAEPLGRLHRHQGGRRPERGDGRDRPGRGDRAGRVGDRVPQVGPGIGDTREIEIKATEISGDISAETVNGGITLLQIESANTEANTVNGDITYDGTIKDAGRYRFSTHDGDLRISVPEKANVSVSVSTFNGDFNACFPVKLTGKTKHRFSFTIGSGSARLEVESFDGDIKLCRPGQVSKNESDKEEE